MGYINEKQITIMKQTAYISGKITGMKGDVVVFTFNNYEFILTTAGYKVVNPLKLKPFLGVKRWLFFMITDIRAIRKVDAVFFMPNWYNSRGAVIEYFFAKFIFKKEIEFLK